MNKIVWCNHPEMLKKDTASTRCNICVYDYDCNYCEQQSERLKMRSKEKDIVSVHKVNEKYIQLRNMSENRTLCTLTKKEAKRLRKLIKKAINDSSKGELQ